MQPLSPKSYGVFIGEEKPGETRALRHPDIGNNPLKDTNELGTKTIWGGLCNTVFNLKLGNNNFLGTRVKNEDGSLGNKYVWKTYKEVYDLSLSFAKGIMSYDLCPEINIEEEGKFKFLGIYCKNREEWAIGDFGSHCNSVTTIPIYDTLGEIAMEHILKVTHLKTIIVEAKCLKKILSLAEKDKHSSLSNLIILDVEEEVETQKKLEGMGFNLFTMYDIISAGEKAGQDLPVKEPSPDDIAVICFTSGTTGIPKGAMLTHNNIMCEVSVITSKGFIFTPNDIYISFLPLAHVMERLIFSVGFTFGVAIGFYSGNARNLTDDAKILKPTCICGVPRIFLRIYEAINDQIEKLPYLKKVLVKQAISGKLSNLKNKGDLTHFLWDKVVFGQMRDILGGKIRFMLTGSAPMEPKILDFLRICFSAIIFEGYGQTETVAGMLITNANENIPGHLGGPGWANEIKLLDHPDLGYTSKDINPETGEPMPRGEILIRGPTVIKKYFCNKEATEESFDSEGWFHSGDVGEMLTNHGNAIRIVDRVKNMFKLSQGEYIAPEKLENVLMASRFVSQLCIVGNPLESYIVAILVPRIDTLIEYFKNKGKEATKENIFEFYEDAELKTDILKDLEKLGRSHDFKGFEVIKKIFISKEPFTVENDLLAPTLKNKRHNIQKKFAKEINELYGR
ncbi:MAG: AMP-binding protein [archaeon]|nr:AMP-binding protein [archaeon]